MGTYCGECDNKFSSDDWSEDEDQQWNEEKDYYVCMPCITKQKLVEKVSELESKVNPDMNNEQYHNQMNLLWDVLPEEMRKVSIETVFEKSARYIEELEGENNKLREIVEWSGVDVEEILDETNK